MLCLRTLFRSAFVSIALAGSGLADVVACDPAIPPGVVCLAGNVSDTAGGGPLQSGVVYHVSTVTVPAGETLTIQPGALLKFQSGAYLAVNGFLDASAGAIYTSVKDDVVGGDTNGDNPEAVPARGDWDGIVFHSTSDFSVLSGADVRFAEVGVSLSGADIFLTNSTIRECSSAALDLSGNSFPVLAGCSFLQNRFAVTGVPLSAIPIFAQLSASGNDLGDYLLVTEGDLTMPFNAIGPGNMPNGSVPLVVCASISIGPGQLLSLQPGLIVKFGSPPFLQPGCSFRNIDVSGELQADGVVFTSLRDDASGGDTNKDGSLTLPAPEDWGALLFGATSDASAVENCTLRYGGDATPAGTSPLIRCDAADVLLDNVACQFGGGAGLGLSVNSFPTVTGCSFSNNVGVAVERVHPGAVAGFADCTASNNAGDYIRLLGSGAVTLTGSVTIDAASALNQDGVFVVADDLTVAAGGLLSLGTGVVFKWTVPDNHQLTVAGTLTVAGGLGSEVVFTSMADDAVVGDTNKDGGASQAAPGDWNGIRFNAGSDASSVDRARVRYAGNAALVAAAVLLNAASPTITFTTVERSETACMSLLGGMSFPQVSDCAFLDSARSVVGVPIRAVPGFLDNDAAGNALGDRMRITNGDVSFGAGALVGGGAIEIGPANAVPAGAGFVLADDIDVPAGFHLGVLPGTVVHFDGLRELDVDGTVSVGGIGGAVVFTSLSDGAPGDWRQIHVSANGSSFENVVVRYAGNGGIDALRIVGSSAQLHDVTIADCAGTALGIPGSTPVVDGCRFDRNALAVNQASIRALPGFSNNSAEDNALGDYVRVTDGVVAADLLVAPSQSPNGGPIVLAANVNVLAGNELTLAPGLVLKFEGARLVDVDGRLVCDAAPGTIVFTTLLDDIAGDTNHDGSASSPAPGAWQGLQFDGDGSRLVGGRLRYAGALGVSAIGAWANDLLVVDTFVEHAAADGMRMAFSSRPEVRRTRFDDGLGLPVNFASLAAVPGFTDNGASGNLPGDYLRVTSGVLDEHVVIARPNTLNSDGVLVVATTPAVGAGQTLELRQGVLVKWEGNRSLNVGAGRLLVEGTGYEPVVFTSIHDDATGGDTRKDGAGTLPAPGQWGAVTIQASGSASVLEHLVARYGGSPSAAGAVQIQNAMTQAQSLRAEFSGGDGLRVSALGGPAANWVAFGCAGDGIDVSGGSFDLVHATCASNGGVGVRRSPGHVGALRNSIAFGNAGGAVAGFGPGSVFHSVVGPALAGIDGNLDVDPQFVNGPKGDLRLAAGSPCVDAAVNVPSTWPVVLDRDHRDASRILDDDLDEAAAPDMGAFERGAYELVFGGEPRVATSMTFTVTGEAGGRALFTLGLLDGSRFVRPWGFELHGLTTTGAVIGVRPVGRPLTLPIPHPLRAVGERFGVQALVRPAATAPARAGNFTQVYRARVLP